MLNKQVGAKALTIYLQNRPILNQDSSIYSIHQPCPTACGVQQRAKTTVCSLPPLSGFEVGILNPRCISQGIYTSIPHGRIRDVTVPVQRAQERKSVICCFCRTRLGNTSNNLRPITTELADERWTIFWELCWYLIHYFNKPPKEMKKELSLLEGLMRKWIFQNVKKKTC